MPQPTVLITGCSQGGIGDAMAQVFVARGYRVFAAVRNPAKAVHLAEVEGIDVVTLDVTSTDSIGALVGKIRLAGAGKLEVLVNNAGCGATGPLIDANPDTARRVYDVNVFGVLAVTQAFVPLLTAARGRVLNISSVGGLLAMPWTGTWAAIACT